MKMIKLIFKDAVYKTHSETMITQVNFNPDSPASIIETRSVVLTLSLLTNSYLNNHLNESSSGVLFHGAI